MQKLPHTRSCFVCGEANPRGIRLRMETDGQKAHARFTPAQEHIGFKGVVHGGVLATVLDELMVWACAIQTRRFAFCAELNVRYLQSARPGEPLDAVAEMVENRRNRILEAKAELRSATGELMVSATGKYIPIKTPAAADMLSDVVQEPDAWRLE